MPAGGIDRRLRRRGAGAMFGSSNMDWLSHSVNHEMDVATSGPDIAGRLKHDLFMADFRRAGEID